MARNSPSSKPRRLTNRELADELDRLLTHGARQELGEALLAPTKQWRGLIWQVTREIRRRLCPVEAGPVRGDDDD